MKTETGKPCDSKTFKNWNHRQKKGSGRKRTARTEEHIEDVRELSYSQEDMPGTHKSQHEIARELGISRSSVQRIIKKDLNFKSVKRIKSQEISEAALQRRVTRARALLRNYSDEDVKNMCFQDEKDFTLQVPKNTQNNRIYIKGKKADVSAKRLYHGRNKFSKKIMVSSVVCYEGVLQPFFMNPEKTKVNG